MLRVVDIASHQAGIDPAALDCDAVIVKATGGAGYVNPYMDEHANATLDSGKLLAFYHFANDDGWHTPREEAEHFLSHVRAFSGRFIPVLDWEGIATSNGQEWALEWLQIVASELGCTPIFYGYAGNINSSDYSQLSTYPLWMASYLFRYNEAGWVDDPLNTWALGNWDRMTMYQYTSTGRIDGYDGHLDLSVFYGDEGDWNALIGGGSMRKEAMVQLAIDVANDDSHGYSQDNRWPWEGSDFDCSSLMYWSAHEAGYDVPLSGYTGTMYADFTNAGFTAYSYGSVDLERGDILLAHNSNRQHTEMYIGDGQTVGAHSSETGGIYGQPGDQTGNEISIAPNYGNWDWVLRPPYESGDDVSMAALDEAYVSPSGDGTKGSVKDRLAYTDMRVRELVEPHKSAAGDGKKDGIRDQIDYIDKRVANIDSKVDEIYKILKAQQ